MQGENLNQYEYYICDLKNEVFPLKAEDGECVLNIVNIPKTKLLKNGKWFLLAKKNDEYIPVTISSDCGYQLDHLDKVYRYGKEKYAYIVTFAVKDVRDLVEKITFPSGLEWHGENDHYANDMVCCIHTTYMMINKKNDKRNIVVESKNLAEFLKKAMFIILKRVIDLCYQILTLVRKRDGKHILLMSETRTPISGNLLALDNRLKERNLDRTYCISYSFAKTLQQSKWKTFLEWSRLLWLISGQDMIFVDDYVPIFKTIHLKKSTKLIQLWHAGVGFKSVGYSRFGKQGSPHPTDSCHRCYDYAIVGGRGLIDVYEEVFAISKTDILPYGLARLDGYMNEDKIQAYKDSFYHKYPELKDKKIILFAPTYRGKTQEEAYYPAEWVPQDQVVSFCGNQYVFGYKMHPFIKEKVGIAEEYKQYIYDFTDERDINELFYVTEILITDFSSNIYEFSLQRKPIIFYAPDKDYYQLTRGVHRTLDQAPGVVCVEFKQVINTIKNEEFELEKLDDFVRESFDIQNKYASDRLIDDLIIGCLEDKYAEDV